MDKMPKKFKEDMLRIINEDLDALYYEMKELDRQRERRQERVKDLLVRKDEILNSKVIEDI